MSKSRPMRERFLRWAGLSLEVAGLLLLALWFGGFTIYAASVVNVLHDRFGAIETGYVSQEVADQLNWLGLAATVAAWMLPLVDPRARRGWTGLFRIGLTTVASIALAALFVLNGVLDRMLGTTGLRGFYRPHETYLVICTVEWGATLLLLAIGFGARRAPVAERD